MRYGLGCIRGIPCAHRGGDNIGMNIRSAFSADEFLLRLERGQRRYVPFIIAICLAIGASAIIVPVLRNRGFPLDDSWIYQVIGRNTAQFGVPGFLPGLATGGSSSTIWPWIIAVNYRLFPALSPVVYLLIVNLLWSCLIAVLLFKMAIRDRLSSIETVALAALPAITGNFAWFMAIGMEHLMFIATVFLAAYYWDVARTAAAATRPILAGVFLGLSIAVRPEALVFLPIFLAVGWWLGKPRRELIALLLPCVAFIAFAALSNLWTSHSLMPVTASGRRWLVVGDLHAGTLALAFRLMQLWALQIVNFFIGLRFAQGSIFYKLVVMLTCALLLAGVYRLWRRGARHIVFLLVLAATNFLVYCVMMPAPGQGMRYQAMMVAFIFPLLALGGLELIETLAVRFRSPPRSLEFLGAGSVTAVFVLAFSSLHLWSDITDIGIRHINGTEIRMARWLNENLTPSTRVASYDIGAIGFFGHVRLFDLGGLTDPKYIPYLFSGRAAEYLKAQDVDWVVISAGQALRAAVMQGAGSDNFCDGMTERLKLCDSTEMHKTYVTSFETPSDVWDTGFKATQHADQAQVLYKITWNH
jgi:hypothetical protein